MDEFLPIDYFEDINTKIRYNAVISDMYDYMVHTMDDARSAVLSEMNFYTEVDEHGVEILPYDDMGLYLRSLNNDTSIASSRYFSKARRVSKCMSQWTSDYYRFQSVKDIKRIQLCKDKFCYNCQSMLAQKRYQKYVPYLKKVEDDYQLLHIVFTIPNVSGGLLLNNVKVMYNRFGQLVRYLDGRLHIHGLDFSQYGYAGALRSFECTYNSNEDTFHPHFHCIFAFSKDYDFTKGSNLNRLSYDRVGNVRYFTDFEVLFQKIWCLLIDGKTVTKANIDDSDVYDVVVMPADGYYHECFKYATKGVFKQGVFDQLDFKAYDIFSVLQPMMDKRRCIQGYGIFYGIDDSDQVALEEDFTEWYKAKVEALRSIEDPKEITEDFKTVYEQKNSVHYMSKFNLKQQYLEIKRLDDLCSKE